MELKNFDSLKSSTKASKLCGNRGDGQGGMKTLCINMSFSQPRVTENPQRSSIAAESSRVLLGDVTLAFDWLTRLRFFVLHSDWLPTTVRLGAKTESVCYCNNLGNGKILGFRVFAM